MNRIEDNSPHKSSNKTVRVIHYVMLAVAAAAIFVSGAIITIHSYSKLQKSITEERVQYVSELTSQITEKVVATITKQKGEIEGYANLVNVTAPSTFVDLRRVFEGVTAHISEEEEDILLFASENGIVFGLDGTAYRISDQSFLSAIGKKRRFVSAFSPITTYGDYWLFGGPIEPITVDGIRLVAVIRAYKNNYFQNSLTFKMFDASAMSFLIDDSGCFLMKPESTNGFGNNLMNYLEEKEVDAATLQKLEQLVTEHRSASEILQINGAQWLLQTTYAADEYTVVVLLPVEAAAANTIHSVNTIMLHIALFLLVLMLSLFSLLYILIRRNAQQKIQSEHLKAEMVLQLANKKNDFLSKMSHEIRTPLNGILGELYLASENIDHRAELAGGIERIKFSADYLLSLVNDILDMSKIEGGKMKLAPAANNAEDILVNLGTQYREQIEAKHIRFTVSGNQTLPDSYVFDKLRVMQILMNLISNAIKFTPHDGAIAISLSVKPLDEKIDTVIYTVSDTGEGMSEEFMSRIFQPFEQASSETAQTHGGSGLGLSIVKSLTSLMNGKVEVQSKLGEGSIFTVSIPMEKAKKVETVYDLGEESILPDGGKDYFHGQHVLVCEDNMVNIKLMKGMLTHWGLDAVIAKNGKLGVETFERSPPGYYSLILMDIRMPVMDGNEAAMNIRASEHPDAQTIPIYALSANSFDEDVQKSFESGMNGHMSKPVKIPVLQKLFVDIMKEGKETHENR